MIQISSLRFIALLDILDSVAVIRHQQDLSSVIKFPINLQQQWKTVHWIFTKVQRGTYLVIKP